MAAVGKVQLLNAQAFTGNGDETLSLSVERRTSS